MVCEYLEESGGTWIDYFTASTKRSRSVKGRVLYVPSPSDISRRALEVRWLEECGFPRRFVVNVMEHDNPIVSRVKQMVARYGPMETFHRCEEFLVKTEYDGEKGCRLA